jgi:poly(A) polymerase
MILEKYNLEPEIVHLLQQTAQFFSAHHCRAYLVGGSVRDLLLNVPCTDWDIATDGDVPELARELANMLGGYYAHMNDKACRITVKDEQRETVLDIAPLRSVSIEEDLRLRDFTLNAIAVPLSEAVQSLALETPLPLLDPLHGADDLEARCLRAVGDTTFQQDPLRMLRALRFMQRYQLTIEHSTDAMLTRDASLLTKVAAERIHDELYAILEPESATGRLRLLDRHGILTVLLPEFAPARGMPQPALHYWDVLEHSLETVRYFEHLVTLLQLSTAEIERSPLDLNGQGDLVAIQVLLREAEQQGIFSLARVASPIMKLAALLHDIGKTATYTVTEEGNIHFYGHPQVGVPLAQQMMRRLSASTQDRRLVQQVVAHHMRPGQLSHDAVTQRAIRRYFVDLGPVGINVALVSLADHLAMRGPEPLTQSWQRHLATVRLLLNAYIRERESILPPRLIQADELLHRLHITPGPLVGHLLEAIAEAQADGSIHSKEEALWLAEEMLARPDLKVTE